MSIRDGITIVVGHANPDFDAYAATVAGTRLFPGAHGVFLGTQNMNVREFHQLHGEFLDFVEWRSIDRGSVVRLVMVDTRDASRLGELSSVAEDPSIDLVIYDHHPPSACDIGRGEDRSRMVGAVTSVLVHELRERELALTPLEASVMLLGIHEDTGSLTFPGSTAYDADAVAYLMAQGADMEVVNRFLYRTLTAEQRLLLDELSGSVEIWDIHGRPVAVAAASAEGYVDSAGIVTHHLVEDMGHRVAIASVQMPGRIQLIGRSRVHEVDIGAVFERLGGGGHAQAASAAFKDITPAEALDRLRAALEAQVVPPLTAADIATAPVRIAEPTDTMAEVGSRMMLWGHGGLPVVDGERVIGIVTRRDVDKAIRHGLGHAPVTGFVTRGVRSVSPETDLDELERIMSADPVGRLPVIDDGRLVGIVSRKDLLLAEYGHEYLDRGTPGALQAAKERFLRSLEEVLPVETLVAVKDIGSLAQEQGIRAYLVGGFVRDMLLGRPNLDIDVVIEGDGVAFAKAAGERLGARVRTHVRFGTAVLVFPNGQHIDVTTARTEYYAKPGALPTVERSSLRQDLLRRDFSINAIAAAIDPAEMGMLSDPFGGLGDLEKGMVRVLHALSFIEDPTRVLRAVRFERRFGFSMDEETERLARSAVETGSLNDVTGARIREELLAVLEEADPEGPLRRLGDLGALGVLLPDGVSADDAIADVSSCLSSLTAYEDQSEFRPDRTVTLLTALAGRATERDSERWARRLRLGYAGMSAASQAAKAAVTVLERLSDPARMTDSRLHDLLGTLRAEVIVYLHARGDEMARKRLDRFIRVVSTMRLEVSGEDLVALGAIPGPAFSGILADILQRRLDGVVQGREQELEELRKLAVDAGLIPSSDG